MRNLILLIALVFSSLIFAQEKAFSGALGGGAYARGDVQYSLYTVTNLNGSGAGSYFNGLKDSTIMVMAVSGTAALDLYLTKSFKNLIILGQTAPEGGFTLTGQRQRWENVDNAVIRYVSYRSTSIGNDGIDCINCSNVIFDRTSHSFGGDESLTFRGTSSDVTVQNSMFSYAKTLMLFGDANVFTDANNLSFLFNLGTQNSHRTPNPYGDGRMDIVGNVYYNFFNRLMRTGGSGDFNEIGNFYAKGQNTNFYNQLDDTYNPSIYSANNRVTNVLTSNTQDNYAILWQDWDDLSTTTPASTIYKSSTMFPLVNFDVPIPNGDDAYTKAVTNRDVGNNAYLDNNGNRALQMAAIDSVAIDDIVNKVFNTWTTADDYEFFPQRTDYINNTVTGVVINTHSPTTHEGVVPKSWITSQNIPSWNTDTSNFDPLGHDLHATYTNIEMYSFQIDVIVNDPVTLVEVSPSALNLNINNTYQLSVAITGTIKTGNWGSSDGAIATVDQNGLVTALSQGTTTIAFTSDDDTNGDITGTIVITVFSNSITIESNLSKKAKSTLTHN